MSSTSIPASAQMRTSSDAPTIRAGQLPLGEQGEQGDAERPAQVEGLGELHVDGDQAGQVAKAAQRMPHQPHHAGEGVQSSAA